MDRILFLGVEGSGKTVLNMALAKVFAAHPDAGYRLKPENRDAFRFLERLPSSLYAVPLPPERPGRYTDLRWSVCRGSDTLLELDIPECPPDLFRLAFQNPSDDPDSAAFAARAAAAAEDLKLLRDRIAGASHVYVLFDVSRLRGDETDDARLDAVWATNACLRHLRALTYPPKTALVLTHADRDPAAGNDFPAILRNRLPLLADNYPDLVGVAVSSVKPDDPDFGLQPLLFRLLADTPPLAATLAEGARIWQTLAGDNASDTPDPDALRTAADRLDALRASAPWFAQGPHARWLSPLLTDELRRLADSPSPSIAQTLREAFPDLHALASAPAPKPSTPAKPSAKPAPTPAPAPSAPKSSSSSSSSSSKHRHRHHHHHGGRRTPTRRFFDKTKRYISWGLATLLLALAFTYGIPAAKHAWGRHCMERGLRLLPARPDAAFRAFRTASRFKSPGADIGLTVCRQAGLGCAADPDAAAASFAACRWTYSRPESTAMVQRLVRAIRRQADSGDAATQYLLGLMHETGSGLPADSAEAARRMEQAASSGQPQALQWIIAKARGGDTDSQVFLGRLYLAGKGPGGHDAESVRWVLLAANKGAEGGPAWLSAQAESGNPAAQYTLGRKAELQSRKTGNLAPALDWYRKAAAQGHPEAQAALARLAPE